MKLNTKLLAALCCLLAAVVLVMVYGYTTDSQIDQVDLGQGEYEEAGEDADADVLHVVTTVFPPYDFVKQVGGAYVEVSMLLAPGMESHSYEPTPRDMIKVLESDLFIYAGKETDLWVDELLEGEKETIYACAMLDWVDAAEEEHVEGMQIRGEHEPETDGHTSKEYDEHVWTSPKNAICIAGQICETLSELDPAHADLFRANAEAYIAQLEELDEAYEEVTAHALRKELIFADRFPFLYMTQDYGLSYYAAFPGCSSETEPSAATIAFLIDKIEEDEIPLVLYLELSNHRVADMIAETTGVKTAMLHSCHNVTKEQREAGITYLTLMRNNLEVLKEALN